MVFQEDMQQLQVKVYLMFSKEIKPLEFILIAQVEIQNSLLLHIKSLMTIIVLV